MLVNKTFFIDSVDDAELDIKRTSKLEYRVSYDPDKELKAIVFIIAGHGGNKNISFLDFDRDLIASRFDCICVTVFYHCFCMRICDDDARYSARVVFEQEDLQNLQNELVKFEIDARLNTDNAFSYYEKLIQHIKFLKASKQLPLDYKAILTSSFIPPNDEYQNFGIMASLDHINVLKHLVLKSGIKHKGGG